MRVLGILVDVEYDAASDLSDNTLGSFNLSRLRFVEGNLNKEAISIAPKASIDLVVKADVGVSGTWFAFGADGRFGFTTADDFKIRYPIRELNPQVEFFEYKAGNDTGLKFSIPELPELSGNFLSFLNVYTNAGVQAHADTSEDPFLTIKVDFDEIVSELVVVTPPLKAAYDIISTVVFFDEDYDLGKYIDVAPKGKAKLQATVVDAGISVEAYVEHSVYLAGDLSESGLNDVVLRSDHGTLDDYSDDQVHIVATSFQSSPDVFFDYAGMTLTDGIGTAKITAYYVLNELKLRNDIDIGVNGELNVEVLKGSLSGSWMPEAFRFKFNPLIEFK